VVGLDERAAAAGIAGRQIHDKPRRAMDRSKARAEPRRSWSPLSDRFNVIDLDNGDTRPASPECRWRSCGEPMSTIEHIRSRPAVEQGQIRRLLLGSGPKGRWFESSRPDQQNQELAARTPGACRWFLQRDYNGRITDTFRRTSDTRFRAFRDARRSETECFRRCRRRVCCAPRRNAILERHNEMRALREGAFCGIHGTRALSRGWPHISSLTA
jgi:hypothetical protein